PPRGGSQNSLRWLRHENNSHTAIKTDKTSCQTTANKQRFLTLLRHYAASGLLNLRTTLTKAVTPVTPGVKLPEAKIKQK
ncbi:hypothetical protein, partial [uncultured Alistipes sp.]|uniref:hypothetical protein n=1 Tax=uncultured Alistipes sp. TaxID=538949 RepID=UPI00272C242A